MSPSCSYAPPQRATSCRLCNVGHFILSTGHCVHSCNSCECSFSNSIYQLSPAPQRTIVLGSLLHLNASKHSYRWHSCLLASASTRDPLFDVAPLSSLAACGNGPWKPIDPAQNPHHQLARFSSRSSPSSSRHVLQLRFFVVSSRKHPILWTTTLDRALSGHVCVLIEEGCPVSPRLISWLFSLKSRVLVSVSLILSGLLTCL